MVVSCCAYGCTARAVKGGPITFHCFPKDEHRRKIWESKICRKNFKATNSSRLCSQHFPPYCYDREKFGGTWLKKTAVPTIFNFPNRNHIEKKITCKSSVKKTSGPEPVIEQEESFTMPNFCSAYGCSNTSSKASCKENGISFHHFPLNDKIRLNQWLVKMKRKKFKPTINTRICSEHFSDEDFEYQPFTNRRGLKNTAVPQKFCFTFTKTPASPSYDFGSTIVQYDTCETKTSLNEEKSTQTNDFSIDHLLTEVERLKTENSQLKTDLKMITEYLVQVFQNQ